MFIILARMKMTSQREIFYIYIGMCIYSYINILCILPTCWKEISTSEIRPCGSAMQFNFPECLKFRVVLDELVCI